MNCVTGGRTCHSLQSVVENVINSNNLYPHPSSWK